MGWDYKILSLFVWVSLPLVALLCFAMFKSVSSEQRVTSKFRFVIVGFVAVQAVLLLSLGLNDSRASLKSLGLEVWACDRQVDVAEEGYLSRVFSSSKSFISERRLNFSADGSVESISPRLSEAGVKVASDQISVPISKAFELKANSEPSLEALKTGVSYKDGTNLNLVNGSPVCASSTKAEWNVFLGKVDNVNKTYGWQRVSLEELPSLRVRAEDGGGLPDCLILDYSLTKKTPEYRCDYLLKNDVERCADRTRQSCEYKEVEI